MRKVPHPRGEGDSQGQERYAYALLPALCQGAEGSKGDTGGEVMLLGHEQPYLTLQALKLRELREELRGRPVSLTGNAIDLASELWQIEDVSRFKPSLDPDPADSLWPFRMT